MHGLAVAGLDVDRGDVLLRSQMRRHREAAIHVADRRRRVRLRVLQNHVGLPERPPAIEIERRGQIGRISFRRAVVGPTRDGVDVRLRENARAIEDAAAQRRLPRRHLARLRHVLDIRCALVRFGVRHQRERTDIAGVMAGLATRLKNADDFLVESRAVDRRGMGRALPCADERERKCCSKKDATHSADNTPVTPLLLQPPG